MQDTSSGKKKHNFHQKYLFESSQLSTLLFTLTCSMLRFVYSIHLLTHTINEMQKISSMMFRTLGEVLYFVFSKICSITAAGQKLRFTAACLQRNSGLIVQRLVMDLR
jgi:hypothetical protein